MLLSLQQGSIPLAKPSEMMSSLAKPLSASLLALSIALSSLWHPAQAGQFCWQSIKGDVLLDIACEAGYSACGAFIRPCTNATHTGCTTEEVSAEGIPTGRRCCAGWRTLPAPSRRWGCPRCAPPPSIDTWATLHRYTQSMEPATVHIS